MNLSQYLLQFLLKQVQTNLGFSIEFSEFLSEFDGHNLKIIHPKSEE